MTSSSQNPLGQHSAAPSHGLTDQKVDSVASSHAFVSSVLGASPYELHPLAGDASARRYFRVVAHDESWVLMVWEPFEDNGKYPFLSVRSHFEKHGVHVPTVAAMSPEKGLVLLEDLGDLTLERKFWENQNQSQALPYYRQAIEELVKIHFDSSFDFDSACTAFQVEFDRAKLLWEMNYAREHFVEGICAIHLNEPVRQELIDQMTDICERLAARPKVICHRDYHSRNLMIKLGRMRVIDFQDARMGTMQYDLVSLLRDSYVQMSKELHDQLLEEYRVAMVTRLSDGDRVRGPQAITLAKSLLGELEPSTFRFFYELQTLQRCFKACGSFASFLRLRNDKRYLKHLAPTLSTLKTTFSLFPEYKGFYQLLDDHGVFEQSFDDLPESSEG